MVSVTGAIKGGPQHCESLQCWIRPCQGDGDGFSEQVVLEHELCRMHMTPQGKGRLKELPVIELAPQGSATFACITSVVTF